MRFVIIIDCKSIDVEFEIFATVYLIKRSLVTYQIGYVHDKTSHRHFQTLKLLNANS